MSSRRPSDPIVGRRSLTLRARALVARVFANIDRTTRVTLIGVVAAAVAAVALGAFITNQTREDLLIAEQRGLQTAVAAIAERLPPIDDPLTDQEIRAVHRLVDEAILGAGHVRVKLWAPDGSIRYSDEPALVGQQFPDEVATLANAEPGRPWAAVSDLSAIENVHERNHGRLVEHYIPLSDGSGSLAGVFEIYSDPAELEAALDRISTATWLGIAAGLGALMLFLFALMWSSMRRLERERVIAQQAAGASAVLVSATDALATSLDPPEMLDRLGSQLASAVHIDELEITSEPVIDGHASSQPLADGSWLTATRRHDRFTDPEGRLLRSVAVSFDAALARAALFDDVQKAATERRRLLRRLDVAHEEERRTIVGELHDLIAGDLIRALYGVRGILGRPLRSDRQVDAELRVLEQHIAATEGHLRGFMARLRPVAADEGGLVLALEQAAGRARYEGGFEVRLRIGGPVDAMPDDAKRAVLRSVQEALLNAQKHASAQHVIIRLRAGDGVKLTVDDDGCGWSREVDVDPGRGLGLAYARERIEALGGSLDLGTSRLGGVRFEARLPMEHQS